MSNETETKTDTPPRRRRRTTQGASSSPGVSANSVSEGGSGGASPPEPPRPSAGGRTLQKKLEEFFGSLAIPYATIGDTYASNLIAQRAPALAEAWADLARQNAGVRRVLERMLQGTAWGAVILSSASLAIPLLAHHGILPLPVDPFAGMYPGSEQNIPSRNSGMPEWAPGTGSPIVPDPPSHDGDYMTPPQSEGAPPGVFTVAGSSDSSVMVPEAV